MNRIVPVDDNCKDKGKHNSIDIIKASVCFLIVGSHCLPLFSNDVANYYYGQWFFRFCVPFFFIVTGLFFSRMDRNRKLQYIKRILLIYLASTALYFPMFFRSDLPQIIWYCIFGYRHLWYLSALAIGLICTYLLEKAFGDKKIVFVAALMGGGVLLDEYYKLLGIDWLNRLANSIYLIGGARHAVLFGLPMLLIGGRIGEQWKHKQAGKFDNCKTQVIVFAILWGIGWIEATLLMKSLGADITTDVTIFGWTPAIPLTIIGINTFINFRAEILRSIRKTIDLVYILHIWVLVLVDHFLNVVYLGRFLLVAMIATIISGLIEYAFVKQRSMSRKTLL